MAYLAPSLVLCFVVHALGMCPPPTSLKKSKDGSFSLCAMLYQTSSNRREISCMSRRLEVKIGEGRARMPGTRRLDFNNAISALVVRNGCTLRACRDDDFQGDCRTFTGEHWRLSDDNFDDDISSFECDCSFPSGDCTEVKETFELLIECDTRKTGVSGECTKSTETGFTQSSTSGTTQSSAMGRSASVEVGSEFLGASVSGEISQETRRELRQEVESSSDSSNTIEINCETLPGKSTRIERRILTCNSFSFLTRQFRCINVD